MKALFCPGVPCSVEGELARGEYIAAWSPHAGERGDGLYCGGITGGGPKGPPKINTGLLVVSGKERGNERDKETEVGKRILTLP